jgi:acetyltransferase-like isoleucine patch superfamily enzyme
VRRRPASPATEGTVALEDGCVFGDGCRILAREGATVRVGARAVFGERCTVVAHAGVTIGEDAVLGDGAMVVDFDHVTADVETPVRLQGVEAAPVAIGARAQIGHGASLLRGVTIGEGAEVGAHAVVTRDVPAGAVVAGVPAR